MAEPDATQKLGVGEGEGEGAGTRPPTQPQPVVAHASDPWSFVPFVQAGALVFLALLAVGGALVIAVKLQFPQLGAGADPVEMLTSLVVLALATLRVPVHVGEVSVTVLPLGVLVATAILVRWACATTIPAAAPRRGPLVGLSFGVIAAIAALIFRFRFETDPIYAGALGAFIAGTIWVSAFATLWLAARPDGISDLVKRKALELRDRRPQVFEGVRAGLLMFGLAAVLASGAALLWAIVVLAGGGGPDYDNVGEIVAALVYVTAFAPNLVVVVISLGLGAPLEIGAGLTLGGRVRDNIREISIFDGSPDAMLLLLLIPLGACLAAGLWSRRHASDPRRALEVLAIAALTFAGAVAVLGAVGDVRLGAQLTPERGFGVVAPRSLFVFVLGSLWAGGVGYAGWTIAERRS